MVPWCPEPFPEGDRPLSGIRALDLTRILAGPIAARTLAENGADVLMVAAEYLPQIKEHVMDTSHGKRSCYLDLYTAEDAAQLKSLVRGADVFSQGYRPGVLSGLGFGPEDVAKMRPGIIYLSISCFGADGPFSHRAGWEQVAQTVTGICQEGGVDRPRLLPAAACDYTTGYLGAYGVLLALVRRAREGELDALRIESETADGKLRHLGPVLHLSETQPHWSRPTPILGGDAPEWLGPAAAEAAE